MSCQICGRRKALKSGGVVRFHNVDLAPCPGAGFPPIEQDDTRLEQYALAVERAEREIQGELLELYDRRANFIPPELIDRLRCAGLLARRIRGRLERHRNWPARFRRQMELYGYGSPPPQYLLDREAQLSADKFGIGEETPCNDPATR